MQDPLLDPLRQRILARMGIPLWQLRAQGLPGKPAQAAATQPPVNMAAEDAAAPHQPVAMPTGKLWLQAEALPAPSLLGDICQWLGIGTDEVSLLGELPRG